MNLRDLQYLVAIAEHRHFGKAAQICFVSQPTLSAQIKKLEDELGVQLLERNNKQVLITPLGEALIAQAKVVLQETNKLRDIAKFSRDPFSGQFKLGIIPTIGPYLLPHILPLFRQQLPKLELRLYEDKTAHIIEQLQQGKLDAIILALPINQPGMAHCQLFNESFVIALPKNHPLVSKNNIKLKDLAEENLLLLEEGHCLADQALEICHSIKLHTNTDYRATSLEMLRQMVATGTGLTLLPALASHANPLIKIKSFVAPIPCRTIGLVWRQQSARQICCETLASLIKGKMPSVLHKISAKL